MRYIRFLLPLVLIVFAGCRQATTVVTDAAHCPPTTFSSLKTLLQHQPERDRPLIMAHRGGPAAGFPENCLPTFARTLASVDCPLIEFDVRMTQDSVLVLLHDNELAYATTGTGLLDQSSWAAVQSLTLKDDEGNSTEFSIPTFTEVLQWFAGKAAIMIIDAKPGTDLDRVLRALAQSGLQHQAVLICYSLEDALTVFAQMPDLMLALGFNTDAQIEAIAQSLIPRDQIVALTPRELQSKAYYKRIHRLGISCSSGTNGNIDTLPLAVSAERYQSRFARGADIICTDRPVEVAGVFE